MQESKLDLKLSEMLNRGSKGFWKFQKEKSVEQRTEEAAKIREKYPDRIPIIAEVHPKTDLPQLDKSKFLVPKDMSIAGFLHVIRKRLELKPEQAIFLFFGQDLELMPTSRPISQVYAEKGNEDGFLYCSVNAENTFGF